MRGVPALPDQRATLLPLASKLATLPPAVLSSLEVPDAKWSVGWSHGKERFEGVVDTAKGSFYANPAYDEKVLFFIMFHEDL